MKVRLFVPASMEAGAVLGMGAEHQHYLRHVLRRQSGDTVYLFNGRDGEWQARLDWPDKKSGLLHLESCVRPQEESPFAGLAFALIKRIPCEWMIEKAVELGVTDMWPLTTQHCSVHDVNIERLQAIAIEAAEQCGRMDVPQVHPLQSMQAFMRGIRQKRTICWADETGKGGSFCDLALRDPPIFLIGPEGGFSADERLSLSQSGITQAVSLGKNIMRAETAALACLAAWRLR